MEDIEYTYVFSKRITTSVREFDHTEIKMYCLLGLPVEYFSSSNIWRIATYPSFSPIRQYRVKVPLCLINQ